MSSLSCSFWKFSSTYTVCLIGAVLRKMHKILAIDDNELFLQSLLILLEEVGMHAIGAHNGYLGLQLAREQLPDLIICDIGMPGFDGYEVLKALRQDPITKRIPLIFLTAEQTNGARRYAMDLGANNYLDKFCILEELSKEINAQIEK